MTVPAPTANDLLTYFTWDANIFGDYTALTGAASIDVPQDCGTFSETWYQDSDSDSIFDPIDYSIFPSWAPSMIGTYTEDGGDVGLYTLAFTMHLTDYPQVVSSPVTEVADVTIKDRCSLEGGLNFPTTSYSPSPGQYFFTG